MPATTKPTLEQQLHIGPCFNDQTSREYGHGRQLPFPLPCLTETYLALEAATKLAWGRESSREKSSSFVTAVDLVLSTALEPIGAKYCPCTSRSAMYPPWYSTEKWQSWVRYLESDESLLLDAQLRKSYLTLLTSGVNLPSLFRYMLLHVWMAYLLASSLNSSVKSVSSPQIDPW